MRKLSMEELGRISPEEYKNASKNPIVIVLDNVRSLHNVGSAFRTSDAFFVEKIYLCGITGVPPNKEINKTALGATESVSWEYVKETTDIVKKLKEEGYTIACVEQTDESLSLTKFMPDKTKNYCFVFGNEVFGVGERTIALSDLSLEIPQYGTKHSLNISVALGIVIWDYLSKISQS